MGSLLHLVDFKHSSMARKVVSRNRDDGGFEAPRNSLELPVETLHNNCAGRFTVPYGYRVTNDWPEKYSAEAPMKRLISEEISKRPNGRPSAPSVVARLMGVDMLPVDTKPIRHQVERKNEVQVSNFVKEEQLQKSLGGHVSFASNSFRRTKFDSFFHKETSGANRRKSSLNSNKSKAREHPQEEELQKFKKEFEARQTARFKEYSKVVELGSIPSQWLAQEDLNKEKMALYANSIRPTDSRKPKEKKVQTVSAPRHRRGNLQHQDKKNESLASGLESLALSTKTPSPDFQQCSLASSDNTSDIAYAPSKIVILRPGPDTIGYNEESWTSSPGISEDRGSIEDFLEEVKERLKHELQGKPSKRSSMARGAGTETPYSEKPSDAKQIAQCIAKQARKSAPGDFRMTLPRSASTRSYKSESQFNEIDSPEFINRDTRRFLAERFRNVLKEEKHQDVPMVVRGSSRSSTLNDERGRAELSLNVLNAGIKARHWDNLTNESDMHSRSFRRDPDDNVMHQEELSPRNLIRSLSAPVSGTFGKLLLADRHMLTGAHIRRKHEVIEKITVNVKNRKKEKSNFREKVSSFKYSLTLRGRLFGKKIQSAEESHGNRDDIMKEILSGPTVMMNYYDRLENSTEVPPSPVSICSSVHEEFWRPADYSSPTSASDVHSIEDSLMPQVFREISSNLNELRRQLNQLEAEGSEGTIIDERQNEVEMSEIEDEVESYIRDLLVCSGLYDGSCDTSLSRWDPLGKPISNQVFEEVEESHRQRIKDDEGSTKNQGDKLNHKILFDLLNEALLTVHGTPAPMSRFLKKATGPVLRPLRGKKLLDHVWEIIRVLVYPPEDIFYYSIDNMVARDLQCTPWSKLLDDDVNALGKEIECQMIGDLIEEIVKDMQS